MVHGAGSFFISLGKLVGIVFLVCVGMFDVGVGGCVVAEAVGIVWFGLFARGRRYYNLSWLEL